MLEFKFNQTPIQILNIGYGKFERKKKYGEGSSISPLWIHFRTYYGKESQLYESHIEAVYIVLTSID